MNAQERYEAWLADPAISAETKAELKAIAGNEKEIAERFSGDLEFGTAGLRGILGAGTNRMNVYTVRRATQGLANYILSRHGEDKGVAIAFDSRHMSPEFADEAACCLAANGIKAYVFTSLRPTPELSFAVRHLHCISGINITASHNPPEYNGYKVYWEDGAQITPPHDTGIMEEVKRVSFSDIKTVGKEEAKAKGLYIPIDKEVDNAYDAVVKAQILRPEAIAESGDKLRIVYTPLHGTGNLPVRRVLGQVGFSRVSVVKEQELPNGSFPTVSYPNPEADEAFTLGLALAGKEKAALVLATDPDADRLGARVLGKDGAYHKLTGNMIGTLLTAYVLSARKEKGKLPKDAAIVRSLVSTKLVDKIAAAYGVRVCEVLTGFKYIGGEILKFERAKAGTYVFGFEESYGCLIGTYARDKDAVSASLALCEAAAYYHTKNQTLMDALTAIYETYGFAEEDILSVEKKGVSGKEEIARMMERLRAETRMEMGGLAVYAVRDYQSGLRRELKTGRESAVHLPKSNVLYYELEGDSWVCARPSGTEPKIKFYFGTVGKTEKEAKEKAAKLKEVIVKIP